MMKKNSVTPALTASRWKKISKRKRKKRRKRACPNPRWASLRCLRLLPPHPNPNLLLLPGAVVAEQGSPLPSPRPKRKRQLRKPRPRKRRPRNLRRPPGNPQRRKLPRGLRRRQRRKQKRAAGNAALVKENRSSSPRFFLVVSTAKPDRPS